MSLLGSVLKNTFFLTIGQLAGKILTVILVAFLARAVGPEGVGKYAFCNSLIAIFLIFSDFGFDLLLVREVAKSPGSKIIENILCIKLGIAVITSFFLFLFMILRGYDQQTIQFISVLLISYILTSILTTFYSISRAYEKMGFQATIILIHNSLRLLFGIVAFKIEKNLNGFVLGLLFADLLCCFGGAYFVNKKFLPLRPKIDVGEIKSIVVSVIPFGILSLMNVVWTNTDTLMIGKLQSEVAVGWYSSADKVLWFLLLIPNMFMNAIFPVLSRLSVSNMNSLRLVYSKAFSYLMVLGFPIGIGGYLVSDQIMLLIYGEQFQNSIIVFQVMVWVTTFGFVSFLNGATLNAIGRERMFAGTYASFTLAKIILDYVLIKAFGYIGACYATLLLTGLGFFLYSIICYRQLAVSPEWTIIGKSLVASVVMGAMILFLKKLPVNVFILIPIGSLIYFVLILLLQVLPKEDTLMLRNLLVSRLWYN